MGGRNKTKRSIQIWHGGQVILDCVKQVTLIEFCIFF